MTQDRRDLMNHRRNVSSVANEITKELNMRGKVPTVKDIEEALDRFKIDVVEHIRQNSFNLQ